MKRLLYILALALALANANAATVYVRTCTQSGKDVVTSSMQYALFRSAAKARAAVDTLKELINRSDSMGAEKWKRECENLKVYFRKTKSTGECFVPVNYPDMAILICTYNPETKMSIKSAEFRVIPIREGQTDYDCVFQTKLSGDHILQEVVTVKRSEKPKVQRQLPSINGDSIVSFHVHLDLEPGTVNEDCRLIVQPYAIEYDTEDTVDYVPGIVMEGVNFHKLQNKRMRYNYLKNDSVAFAYVHKPLWIDMPVKFDTTMVYRKRDVQKKYRINYFVEVADLTHIIYRDTTEAPRKLKDPFELINYGQENSLLTHDEKVERIKMFNIFKGGFQQYIAGQLDGNPAAKARIKEAMDYLCSTAPENRAVIGVVAREELHVPYTECLNLINEIPNDNPKKWYLRGVLEAAKEAEDHANKPRNYIPEYMCYFNHAFELKPAYKWTYFTDGQITDDLRARYKYSKYRIPDYEAMFNERVDLSGTQKVIIPLVDGEGEIRISGED